MSVSKLGTVILAASSMPGKLANINPSIVPEVKTAQVNVDTAMNTVSGLAITPNGTMTGYGNVNTNGGEATVNQWRQFDIVNAAAADVKVRIGSNLSLPGVAAELGLVAGAADTAGMSDQIGAGCLAIRSFGRLTSSKAKLISEIQITSSDANQLGAEIKVLTIENDGTVTPRIINVSQSMELSDQRTNLLKIKDLSLILDSTHCLEFTSKAGMSLTVKLKLVADACVSGFIPIA